ncbi:ABC transporter permease [Allorhizobium pseudoryzae]|uniref:ABC transporter permease n=1 Tax=Allorhizobium pseudoryzae TaxID=379684 RepID=UPI003D00AFF1
MRETLSLLFYLMRLRVRTRLEFRASLVIAWAAQAFGYAGVFTSIWLILTRFENIGGWSWPQMALLLGFHTLGYALGACFTLVQLRRMEEIVLGGEFDTLLVRPLNPWAYLVFSGFNIEYGGHILLGAGLILWALPQLAVEWTIATSLLMAGSLLSAALITASMITIISACAMVLGRARYLFGIYFDFWELSRYPASIFRPLPDRIAVGHSARLHGLCAGVGAARPARALSRPGCRSGRSRGRSSFGRGGLLLLAFLPPALPGRRRMRARICPALTVRSASPFRKCEKQAMSAPNENWRVELPACATAPEKPIWHFATSRSSRTLTMGKRPLSTNF